jgi:hypothetical protein
LPSFSKSVGPNPMVRVSRDGGRPSASPVSSGGAAGWPPTAPRPAGCPAVIASAAIVHSRSIAIRAVLSSVTTSKAAKCSRSWTGVAIPAWFAPWNGIWPPKRGLSSWSAWATLTSPAPMAAPASTPTPPAPMIFLRLGPCGCCEVSSWS